jgi:hypothetical protein
MSSNITRSFFHNTQSKHTKYINTKHPKKFEHFANTIIFCLIKRLHYDEIKKRVKFDEIKNLARLKRKYCVKMETNSEEQYKFELSENTS